MASSPPSSPDSAPPPSSGPRSGASDAGAASGEAVNNQASALDPDLLRLLRCPLTKSVLRAEGEFLIAEVGGLKYPVRDGIPVMLMEEAELPEGVASLDELKRKLR